MHRYRPLTIFKFQSDSINTQKPSQNAIPSLPLNSNLILLIRIRKGPGTNYAWTFKFQSDSINTIYVKQVLMYVSALNSNLILLIRNARRKIIDLIFTLNSNLILLIR